MSSGSRNIPITHSLRQAYERMVRDQELNERSNTMVGTAVEKIEIGELVRIIDQSYGFGTFSVGQIGILVRRDSDNVCFVEVPSVGRYSCRDKDIRLKDERVLKSCTLTQFYTKQRKVLEKALSRAKGNICILPEAKMIRKQEIRRYERMISCLSTPDSDVFNMIKKRLLWTRFVDQTFTFVTDDITIHYTLSSDRSRTIHVPMGKFKVICDFNSKQTLFESYEDNTYSDGRFHPHLGGNNPATACWGTYAGVVTNCYKAIDVSGLISVILDFLGSCDRQGWYTSVLGFALSNRLKEVREQVDVCIRCEHKECRCDDWCGDCDSHVDDCSCNMCGDCDMHVDDCECAHCPDHGDRLSYGAFPDNSCARCEYLLRNIDRGMWECTWDNEVYYRRGLIEYTLPAHTNRHRYRTLTNGVMSG